MRSVCYCGGGDAHEWRPHGGGARILACPPGTPAPEPRTCAACDESVTDGPFRFCVGCRQIDLGLISP